jgi:hypothetical protein
MAAASPITTAATPALSWYAAAVTTPLGLEVLAVRVEVPLPPALVDAEVVSLSGVDVVSGAALTVRVDVAVSAMGEAVLIPKLGGRSTPLSDAQVCGSRP